MGTRTDELIVGLERLGLQRCEPTVEKLEHYLDALGKWNTAFNLVSPSTLSDATTRHVLDCLTVLPFVRGPRLLDVGSGAGLPGLVLAIADPALECTLLDANVKKTRFCLQAVQTLGLSNVTVERGRLEGYASAEPFDTIVSRALGPASSLLAGARRLCGDGARIICMKGAAVEAELDGLGAMLDNTRVEKVEVPGLHAERHLIIIEPPAS